MRVLRSLLAGIILLALIALVSWIVGALAAIAGIADHDSTIDTMRTGYTYLAIFALTLTLGWIIGEVAENIWHDER